jgi:ribonuclease VapC
MVLGSRLGMEAIFDLDQVLELFDIQMLPFTPQQTRLAREAFLRYGKGRHPAGLNFGNCMS